MHHSFNNPSTTKSYEDQLNSTLKFILKYAFNPKRKRSISFAIKLTDNSHSKYFIDLIYNYCSSKNLHVKFIHEIEDPQVIFIIDKTPLW